MPSIVIVSATGVFSFMTQLKQQIQPSHASGSLVHSSEMPFIQQGENILVDARLLHRKLKSKQHFSDWVKARINDYGFEEKVDFFRNLGKSTGGRKSIDYLFTIDTAKELAMLERNEVGRSIRRYFIEKEKELRGITQLPKEAALFKGLKPFTINSRKLFPYREILVRCGYRPNNNGNRRHRYPGHFVLHGKQLLITGEFALHLFHQKQVYNNRHALKAMQPVLPFDFGMQQLQKGGRQ